VDDIVVHFLPAGKILFQIVFSVWVTLSEHKWVILAERRGERRDFWEICEDRYQVRSLILTSQLPVTLWHEQIGDPTVADGILDRLVHNAHRIEMRGDSMRKNRGKPNA
jgi:DNA replication protein DnaC